MEASKEDCAIAQDHIRTISDGIGQELRNKFSHQLIQLDEFLGKAVKRLPSAEALERDKHRKRRGTIERKDQRAERAAKLRAAGL